MSAGSGVTIVKPDLSKLSPDELAFVKKQTGIDEEDALMDHITQFQDEACKVSLFSSCINCGVITFERFYKG